jgi:pseudaminic acid cytidylyltransferase
LLNIAIIPARGGSKRIPRKNIRPFYGKPIIAYAIGAAKQSGLFDSIIVTTDSPEIAEIAIECGADLIIERPMNLADDLTPTVPVIAHAITNLPNYFEGVDWNVCCIYPANPFLEAEVLKAGFDLLIKNENINYVLPVSEFGYPIQRAVWLLNNSNLEMIQPEHALTRSQDLQMAYHDIGQWYWGKATTWIRNSKLLDNCLGIVVPRWKSQDIDNEEDWKQAEIIYKVINSKH